MKYGTIITNQSIKPSKPKCNFQSANSSENQSIIFPDIIVYFSLLTIISVNVNIVYYYSIIMLTYNTIYLYSTIFYTLLPYTHIVYYSLATLLYTGILGSIWKEKKKKKIIKKKKKKKVSNIIIARGIISILKRA